MIMSEQNMLTKEKVNLLLIENLTSDHKIRRNFMILDYKTQSIDGAYDLVLQYINDSKKRTLNSKLYRYQTINQLP